jgi:hypothetical protein
LDFDWESAELLRPLLSKMNLQLPPVLLMLLDKWLVLICDTVVVQKWSFVKPVREMRDRGLNDLVSTVFADILAVCTKDQVLLNLAILSKRRFETDVVERGDFLPICYVLNIVDSPLG